MNVIKLSPIGLCNSASKALDLVYKLRKENKDKSIYILGSLLHNKVIKDNLEKEGIKSIEWNENTINFINSIDSNSIVIFAAHGHSKEYEKILVNRGIEFYDTTCVVIEKIHTFLRFFKNNLIVYVGNKNHDETKAVIANYPNVLLYDLKEKMDLELIKNKVVYVVNQTTISLDSLNNAIKNISKNANEVIVNNSICGQVLNRIKLLDNIPNDLNTILVIGDTTSSNTDYLYKQALKTHNRSNVYKVNSIQELNNLELVNDIYLLSGTSASNTTIEDIENYLKELKN